MTDLTLSNGAAKLAASVYGRPDAPPLLFLHGLGLSRDSWEEGAQRLMDRYQIWTLDFRGHGHSGCAETYDLEGYRSDAEAALAAIARPTLIAGQSLGGVVAVIAGASRATRTCVRPSWRIPAVGKAGEFFLVRRRTAMSQLAGLSARQASWRKDKLRRSRPFLMSCRTPHGRCMRFLAEDHIPPPPSLLSQASALQRQDNRCWALASPEVDDLMVPVPREQPLLRPAIVIQSDARFGAVFLSGHETRFAKTSPRAEIVRYEGAGHSPHRSFAFEDRFYTDLETFASRTFAG